MFKEREERVDKDIARKISTKCPPPKVFWNEVKRGMGEERITFVDEEER